MAVKKKSNPKQSNPKQSNPKKKVVKKVSKSTPKTTVPAKVEPVATTTPVDAKPADTVPNYAEEFASLNTQFRSLLTTVKELMAYTTALERRVAKDQRALQKRVNGKRRRSPGSGQPSGFSKPGPVSDELRAFLKLGKDELIARTEVTKRINAYCKENGLQGEKDKRVLKADKTLTKLLRLKKGDELTFFNLQKYMKVHFPNKEGVYPTA